MSVEVIPKVVCETSESGRGILKAFYGTTWFIIMLIRFKIDDSVKIF